jgi:hypothetical protein
LLAALSLATDLGANWPAETALRTTLLGVGLADRIDRGGSDGRVLPYPVALGGVHVVRP